MISVGETIENLQRDNDDYEKSGRAKQTAHVHALCVPACKNHDEKMVCLLNGNVYEKW